MNRRTSVCLIVLLVGMVTGCAYFQKPEEPPPLPTIEETKPPLTMKSEYFKSFPWSELPSPKKDGNDPDTRLYTMMDDDTLESVAGKWMGSPGQAEKLAAYNNLPPGASAVVGDKIVIPYPIIGVSSQIKVKHKGEQEYGDPKPFPVDFQTGDEYKLVFESNVDGYLYVFREGKGVTFLYPAPARPVVTPKKKGKPARKPQPVTVPADSGKIEANVPKEIPVAKGYTYDPKKAGEMLKVFLSLQTIPELEALKDKPTIRREDLVEVMHRVKEGDITSEAPYKLLRISDPSEILGFSLDIDG